MEIQTIQKFSLVFKLQLTHFCMMSPKGRKFNLALKDKLEMSKIKDFLKREKLPLARCRLVKTANLQKPATSLLDLDDFSGQTRGQSCN